MALITLSAIPCQVVCVLGKVIWDGRRCGLRGGQVPGAVAHRRKLVTRNARRESRAKGTGAGPMGRWVGMYRT